VFSSYGRGSNSEVVVAAVRFVTPAPFRNGHPAGTAKGCRGAARDILVVALAGHYTVTPTHIVPEQHNPRNNSTNKSQAPEDGITNIRNMLSIK